MGEARGAARDEPVGFDEPADGGLDGGLDGGSDDGLSRERRDTLRSLRPMLNVAPPFAAPMSRGGLGQRLR